MHLLKRNSRFIISCFNIGHIPFAPGTWGSLFGLIFSLYIHMSWLFFVATFLLSIYLINMYNDKIDPQWIVIDEFLGIMLCMLLVKNLLLSHAFIIPIVLFLLFRLFDIWKPFPISWIDSYLLASRKTRALGVIMDDIIAGIMAYGVFIVGFLFFYSI